MALRNGMHGYLQYNLQIISLLRPNAHGHSLAPRSVLGDKAGCVIALDHTQNDDEALSSVPVSFTKNGKEICTVLVVMPLEEMDQYDGLRSLDDDGKQALNEKWDHSDVILMSIDNCEEDWSRLHDIRINGQMLEYTGRGKSITDVGLAQARHSLTTRYHYFELQIVDPGENCYIAIGLARRDYPKHRHPGWNRGSIAYHADDGKIFMGTGVGEPFGPECNKDDTMGCGILFPRDYRREWDAVGNDYMDGANAINAGKNEYLDYRGIGSETESEDEAWWENPNAENGTKVQVFFTRNGKTIGKRDVRIPKFGFYPTIGMMSSEEKVRVDLRPLTG